MPEPQNDKRRASMAMVALDTPSLPFSAELFESLEMLSGIHVDPKTVEARESAMIFRLGRDDAAVALVPSPIPWSGLEGPCATAWWWPEATEKMRHHNSHVLVALVGSADDLIRRPITLTQLTASVAAHVDAAGVCWGKGRLVHDPHAFIEQAKDIAIDQLPLHLWIDFRVEPDEEGTHRLFTTGMTEFRQMEIEIPPTTKPPAEIFDFAYSVASHLITSRLTIEDGQTLGRSETEKVQATHAPSMVDPTIEVLRLSF